MPGKFRILIIGGDSFLAHNFIRRYSADIDFSIISRVPTGTSGEYIIDNLFDIPRNNFSGMDTVINFAAIVHRPWEKNKELYRKVNFELSVHLASIAKEKNVGSFIQISTIAVYGNQRLIDSQTPCSPKDFYGIYKLKADVKLLKMESPEFRVVCLRPSMIYGVAGSPGNLTSLINFVNKGIPLPLKGINNKRQFLHIKHFIQALYGIIINKTFKGIIILADKEGVSSSYLIERIAFHLGKKRIPYFSSKILVSLLKGMKPKLMEKLCEDLQITNSYSYEELGIYEYMQVDAGIKSMIVTNE